MEAIGTILRRQAFVPDARFVGSDQFGADQLGAAKASVPSLGSSARQVRDRGPAPGNGSVPTQTQVPTHGSVPGPRRLALVDQAAPVDQASLVDPAAGSGGPVEVLDGALAALRSLADKAVDDVGALGLAETVVFASRVEELSRTLDYLQVISAGRLHRVRNEEPASEPGWTTGWGSDARHGVEGAVGPEAGSAASTLGAGSVDPALTAQKNGTGSVGVGEFRNTSEHLRALLRISSAEARRRLALAEELLPVRGLTGQVIAPRHEAAGEAFAAGEIGSRAAGMITLAVEKVRPYCAPELAAEMERKLTATAAEDDQDFLAAITRRWVTAIDQDGTEPSEEQLRHSQGAFLRRPKHGLQHLEIFATQDQYEHLLTVMNTATNPRTRGRRGPGN